MAWRVRTGIVVLAGALAAACGLSEVGDGPAEVGAEAGTPESGAGDATVDSLATPDGGTTDADAGPDGRIGSDAPAESATAEASADVFEEQGSIADGAEERSADASEDVHSDSAPDGPPMVDAAGTADAPDAAPQDAPSDARTGDANMGDAADGGSGVIAIVQTANNYQSNPTTVTLALPTTARSFLAVLATYAPGQSVQSVSDNAPGGGNQYVSANLRSTTSGQDSEIWYAHDALAGATSVAVMVTGGGGGIAVWVVEASGLGASGGVDDGQIGNGGPTITVVAPTVTPSPVPALIVAAVASNGTLGPIVAGNPFLALPVQNGNGAAYYVPTTPGSYGPVYHNSFSGWNASVAAFR